MSTRRAVVFHRHGGPDVLEPARLPDEPLGPDEVRVEVVACALNRLDLWVRGGLPSLRLPLPHTLGSDIAGRVIEVGARVDPAWRDRRVWVTPGTSCRRCEACLSGRDNLCPRYAIRGETTSGGYTERMVVPALDVFELPSGLGFREAAAIPLTFLTAWQMLVDKARIEPGESLLVHAAGSGVGVAALQIARRRGARVVALASSDAKLEKARQLGAEVTLRSDDPTWPEQVRAIPWVGKRGVDVVFEHVGQATWEASLKLATRGGRIVTCGASSGFAAHTDLRHVFFRQLQILGSTMGSRGSLLRVFDEVARGHLHGVVDTTFPLEAAADAHRWLDRREQFGKVVLDVGEDAA
jgi:NADPH:quinone reductase-like Zn-dependent oxidoreductase